MGFVAPIVAIAAATVGSKLLASKPKPPKPLPIPTRNAAADALRGNDEFARRRGYAASLLTGPSGAEASLGGSKTALGR